MSTKKYEDDDGRRIADMSSVGIPGDPLLGGSFRKKKKPTPPEGHQDAPAPLPPDKKETRRIALHALLAGLAIGLIFIGAVFLFLLFCRYVWFR